MKTPFSFLSVLVFAACCCTTRAFCVVPRSITTKSRLFMADMDQAETLKRLQELVAEHLAVDVDSVTAKADFAKDLGADSLDVIELVLSVENEFDIDIEDNYASKIKTVQDALDYLKESHDINV